MAFNFVIIILFIIINVYIHSQTVIMVDNIDGASVLKVTKKYSEHFQMLTIISLIIIIGCMSTSMVILVVDNLRVNERLNALINQFDGVGLSKLSDHNPVLTEYDKRIIAAWNRSVSEVDSLNEKRESYFKNMVHDLKTPIQLLSMNIQMIKEDIIGNEYIEALEEELSLLNEMVINFLFIEKITYFEKANKTEVYIEEYFKHITNRYSTLGYTVEVNLKQKKETIFTDEMMLSRIVENIIENAVKHGRGESMKVNVYDNRIEFVNKVKEYDNIGDIFKRKRSYSIIGNGLGTEIINTYINLLEWSISSQQFDGEFQVVIKFS